MQLLEACERIIETSRTAVKTCSCKVTGDFCALSAVVFHSIGYGFESVTDGEGKETEGIAF